MKYGLNDCDVDNRDPYTTDIVLPTGDVLEITQQDLIELLQNMEQK